MHVGVDLLFLAPGESGGRETYARELIAAIGEHCPHLRLTAFVNQETAATALDDLSGFAQIVELPVSGRSRWQWAWGEVQLLPSAAARVEVDVLHSLANFGPLGGKTIRVLTLHDLLFRRHPELHSQLRRLGTEALVPRAARAAHHVITVSASSRDEIVAELGVPAERITVVPNGYGLGGTTRPPDAERARARLAPGARHVVLAVASDLPHKNLGSLVRAVATIPPERRPLLAFAGYGTDTGELAALARELGVQQDVRLLGAASVDELEDLYALADVLATPTLYEGFGLPVIEAMARDLPVLCSDIPVLREVAGDAATYFDPRDAASIAAALTSVLEDHARTRSLRAAGRQRAARYTWRASARATAAVYERTVAESRSR